MRCIHGTLRTSQLRQKRLLHVDSYAKSQPPLDRSAPQGSFPLFKHPQPQGREDMKPFPSYFL